jgi:hypothetical protein
MILFCKWNESSGIASLQEKQPINGPIRQKTRATRLRGPKNTPSRFESAFSWLKTRVERLLSAFSRPFYQSQTAFLST